MTSSGPERKHRQDRPSGPGPCAHPPGRLRSEQRPEHAGPSAGTVGGSRAGRVQLTSLSCLKEGPGGPGGPWGPGGPLGPTPGSPWGQNTDCHTRVPGPALGRGGDRPTPSPCRPGPRLTFSPLGPTSPGVPGKPCGPVSPWKTEARKLGQQEAPLPRPRRATTNVQLCAQSHTEQTGWAVQRRRGRRGAAGGQQRPQKSEAPPGAAPCRGDAASRSRPRWRAGTPPGACECLPEPWGTKGWCCRRCATWVSGRGI